MPFTPNDILQKRFGSSFRGLPADEVYAFIRTVAEELEGALRTAADAAASVRSLEDQLDEYRHMESTLRNTLVSSQKVSQEIRVEAEHRRELILREADLEAERRLQEVERRRHELEQEIFQLVAQRRRFEAEFAALIETHTRLLHHNQGVGALPFDDGDTKQLAFEDMESEAPPNPETREDAESNPGDDT